MVQHKGSFRSGSLAKAVRVSADTIRHYERLGVLPRAARTESGYRVYPATAVERVRVVRNALRLGFSLPELAAVFQARDAGGAPCRRVYELAEQKLELVSRDIEALRRTERFLKQVLSDWSDRLKQATPGQNSHLLYKLAEAPPPASDVRKLDRRKTE